MDFPSSQAVRQAIQFDIQQRLGPLWRQRLKVMNAVDTINELRIKVLEHRLFRNTLHFSRTHSQPAAPAAAIEGQSGLSFTGAEVTGHEDQTVAEIQLPGACG